MTNAVGKWLDNFKARYRWSWSGTVVGLCHWNHKDGTKTADYVYWNLYQRADGKRRYDVTGDPIWANSSHVKEMHAAVRAWKQGGPWPPLSKSATPSRPKPQLISFPGGKGGAA